MSVIRKSRKAVKSLWRNFSWSLYGPQVKNPALPANPQNVVFLCLGNICRSAYAHHFAYYWMAKNNRSVDIKVTSAGLHVKDSVSPENAVAAAHSRGVDLDHHTPRQIDEDAVEKADMILAMEPKQLGMLRRRFPQYSGKLFLLSLFEERSPSQYGPWQRYHIEDPYGKPVADVVTCFTRIERCVTGLMNRLS
jgi:protein-tyrosine phosphatase